MKNSSMIIAVLFCTFCGIYSSSSASELQEHKMIVEVAPDISRMKGLLVGRNYEPGDNYDWKYYSLYMIVLENEDDAKKVSSAPGTREIIYNSLSYREMIKNLGLPASSKIVKVIIKSSGKYCLKAGAVLDIERAGGSLWKLSGIADLENEDEEDNDIGMFKSAEVLGVIDGGVLILKVPNYPAYVWASLMGIEVPDSSSGICRQRFAKDARDYLESLVNKKKVRLSWDKNSKMTQDSRFLPYVFLPDNVSVNAEMIKKGFGSVPENWKTDMYAQYKKLEEDARKQKSGIWGKCTE